MTRSDRAALFVQRRVIEGDVIVMRPAVPRQGPETGQEVRATHRVGETGQLREVHRGAETGQVRESHREVETSQTTGPRRVPQPREEEVLREQAAPDAGGEAGAWPDPQAYMPVPHRYAYEFGSWRPIPAE